MKTICRYSGIEFETKGFKHLHNLGVHPIFNQSVKELLNMTSSWAEGSYTPQENYLFFLALLKSSDLVDWNVPVANLKYSTVQKNMELMIKTMGWLNAIGSNYMNRKHYVVDVLTQNIIEMPLPRFTINHSTCSLDNITHWLDSWNNCKADWLDHYKNRSQRTIIANREQALLKIINNKLNNPKLYASRLAEWAMDAANVPISLRDHWTKIFMLTGMNVYAEPYWFIDEVVEHMEEFLEHGTTFAHNVLKHLRSIQWKNKKGLLAELGMDDITIVEDDVESFNKRMMASTAPSSLPLEKDYPNKLAYLKAKAAFSLASSQKAVEAVIEKSRKLEAQQEQLDRLHELEETSVDEDIAQLAMDLPINADDTEEDI